MKGGEKMKKTLLTGLMLLVTCAFITGSVWAETVKGTVGKVDATANSISVAKTDPATGVAETVVIAVKDSTGYTGVAALTEVKEGNTVTIEAEKDEAGIGWVAKSVEIVRQ